MLNLRLRLRRVLPSVSRAPDGKEHERSSGLLARRLVRATALITGALLAIGAEDLFAQQEYPVRPIRLIVPTPPGGGADTVARLLAEKLATKLGASVVVENRPGATGIIGAEVVAKSAADGYTLLYDSTAHAVNPTLRKLPFNTLKDFVPVVLLVVNPTMLVVPVTSPAKKLEDMVSVAAANPGKMTFASAGPGTLQHLVGELFNAEAKLKIVHIPYKGGGQVLPDLLAGRVDMYFPNIAFGLAQVKAGKLRGLAVTSAKRSPSAPDVPTMAELGYPAIVAYEWNGVFVPAGTPPGIVAKLNAAYNEVLADPEIKQRLFDLGAEGAGGSPEDFARHIRAEMTKWERVVREAKITVD